MPSITCKNIFYIRLLYTICSSEIYEHKNTGIYDTGMSSKMSSLTWNIIFYIRLLYAIFSAEYYGLENTSIYDTVISDLKILVSMILVSVDKCHH